MKCTNFKIMVLRQPIKYILNVKGFKAFISYNNTKILFELHMISIKAVATPIAVLKYDFTRLK